MLSLEISLGNNIKKKMHDLAKQSGSVTVGYLNNAELNKIAKIQEFGATIVVTKKMRNWFIWVQKEKEIPSKDMFIPKIGSTLHIPPRAFMRKTFNDNSITWISQLTTLLKKYNMHDALEQLGIIIRKQIIASIKSNMPPPNHPFTVLMKDHNKTLIGKTGAMSTAENIDIKVE